MSRHVFLFLILFFFVKNISAQISCDQFMGAGFPGEHNINGLAADDSGNVFITGFFKDSLNLGGQSIVGQKYNSYIASLDGAQHLRWIRVYAHDQNDITCRLLYSPDGNVYVAGSFIDSISIDGFSYSTLGIWDIYVAKLNASTGTCQWLFRGGSNGSDICREMQLDNSGNLLLTGGFWGFCRLGTFTLICSGTMDVFLMKMDPLGNVVWAKQASTPNGSLPYGLSTVGENGIAISGNYSHTLNFGNSVVLNAANNSSFVACYDSSGFIRWAKNGISTAFIKTAGDEHGNVYALDGNYDFITKYSPLGDSLVSLNMDIGAPPSPTFAVLQGFENNLYLSGRYSDSMSIGNHSFYSANHNAKLFLAILDTSFNLTRISEYEDSLAGFAPGMMCFGVQDRALIGGFYQCNPDVSYDSIANLPCDSVAATSVFILDVCLNNVGIATLEDEAEKPVVYPNPAIANLNVELNSPVSESIGIQLIDPTGRLIRQWSASSQKNKLDLTGISTGIYFLTILKNLKLLTSRISIVHQ